MPWTKPDFEEIPLCMEVTAYVNTDEEKCRREVRSAPAKSSGTVPDGKSRKPSVK